MYRNMQQGKKVPMAQRFKGWRAPNKQAARNEEGQQRGSGSEGGFHGERRPFSAFQFFESISCIHGTSGEFKGWPWVWKGCVGITFPCSLKLLSNQTNSHANNLWLVRIHMHPQSSVSAQHSNIISMTGARQRAPIKSHPLNVNTDYIVNSW